MKPSIPVPILRNLQCGHCRKIVSCGPVFVTPDSSILCGRCLRFAKRTYQNLAFEAVASMFGYPCYYWPKHCNELLDWGEALDHEKNCIFQSSCNVLCSKPSKYFKSERKFPNITEYNLEHVSDETIQKLKCVACESYLSNTPVYILVDGKNICHRCVHSNGVPKGAIRNLAYETIAQALIFPCIYRYRGCTIRLKFGREMWGHENECPFGQAQQKLFKKASKAGKDGKERGVIETHSGHIWGTITPHSALFAPPKTKHNDGKIVTQELNEIMKKKHQDEFRDTKGYDVQSVDSMASRASTFDSLADNISRSLGDNISRDNISRSTIDNISRTTVDNVSRTTVDNFSRTSSTRVLDEHPRPLNDIMLNENYRPSVSGYPHEVPRPSYYNHPNEVARPSHQGYPNDIPRQSHAKMPRLLDELGVPRSMYPTEVAPIPTPPGYNKIPYNGYYHENTVNYGPPLQFDYPQSPIPYPNLNYSGSFNYAPNRNSQIAPKRSESFRVGNQSLIEELKERNRKQNPPKQVPQANNPYDDCNKVQDLVHRHDEVFH